MTRPSSRGANSADEAALGRFTATSIPKLLLWLLILGYVVFFSAYSLQRHATFNTFAADLSYIDQPMWNTLRGRFLERTLDDRQVPRVAEHLEPIILLIALIFILWDDVRAILIIQALALALGALPVYGIARETLSSKWLPLVFVVAYLMFPALQAANVADFHADPFVVAPLLFAYWYAIQHRYRAMWAWAIVAMLVKENLPTLTLMLGLYLLFCREAERPMSGEAEDSVSHLPDSRISSFPNFRLTTRQLHGLGLMAVSLAWFYVATFLIVAPLARQVYGTEGPIYLASRYSEFGGGLTGLLRGLLARPIDVLALLWEPDRLGYLVGLFTSVGWMALLAPEYLLLGLPVLLANILSNFPGQYSGEQHYSAPLVPAFLIAAIYGFRRVNAIACWRRGGRALGPYAAVLLAIWLLSWSLGYHYLRGWTPIARDFHWPKRTPHHQQLARFAGQIPPNASLSTTPPLHPHLAHREKIYVFPTVADADFVLLDVASRTDAHPNDVRATFDALVGSEEFGVVDAADGYVLLSRGRGAEGNGEFLPEAFYNFARVQNVRPQYPALVEYDDQLRLLGYDVIDDPKWQQTYLRFYWQALQPVPEGVQLWPIIFNDAGVLIEDTSLRPMVAPVWYPPSEWLLGETIVTETLPWTLGPRFKVGLAVLRGAPGLPGSRGGQGTNGMREETSQVSVFTDPGSRLYITDAGPGVSRFHGNTWAQVGAFVRDGHYLVPSAGGISLSPVEVTFAEGIHLTGSGISEHQSRVSVVLRWQPSRPVARNYTVFVHVVGPNGTVVSQSDAEPAWVIPWPTDRWSPDEPVLDGHQLLLPPDLLPGGYQVQVGLYYWETLERLPVLNEVKQPIGDHVVLSEIQIEP